MLKKFMAGTVVAGALAIPLSGVAWADQPDDPGGNGRGNGAENGNGNGAANGNGNDAPNGNQGGNRPDTSRWSPSDPPGQNPFGPPGQVSQGNVEDAPEEFVGVPPGQWDDPEQTGLPLTWTPPNGTEPLPLVWNPDEGTWGVWVGDEFVPFTPDEPEEPAA